MLTRTAIATIALLAGLSTAYADSFGVESEVDGHPGVTYLDLVRLIVPDARLVGEAIPDEGKYPDAAGKTMIELRHLTPSLAGPPPAKLIAQHVDHWTLRADGTQYNLIKLDLGQNEARPVGTSVLALLDGDLKLVDAAEFALDAFVHNVDFDPIAIGDDNDGIVFLHQWKSYARHTLVYVHDGKIGQTPPIQSFEDGGGDCAEPRQTWAEISSYGEPGSAYWPLTMTLHDNRTLPATLSCSELGDNESPVVTTATYRWDEAKDEYVGDHSALDAVAATLPARTE